MTLLDWILIEAALVISYFGGISYVVTLMIAIAAIIVVRLVRGERAP
jgi:hypothetical protein